MTTSLDINNYEAFWKDVIYAKDDTTFEMTFSTKGEAQAMRLRGYGFQRALKAFLGKIEVADGVKRQWLTCSSNMRLKELVIRQKEGKWVLIIRPRVQLKPEIKEVPTVFEDMLPSVQARVLDRQITEEAEVEYQRGLADGSIQREKTEREKADDALATALEALGVKTVKTEEAK